MYLLKALKYCFHFNIFPDYFQNKDMLQSAVSNIIECINCSKFQLYLLLMFLLNKKMLPLNHSTKLFNKKDQAVQLGSNPFHPNISNHIPHTVLYTFPK